MVVRCLLIAIVVILVCGGGWAREFDPDQDGWHFENWGEGGDYCIDSCDFSWDLYRQTYLGINPTNDALQAPLDVAFYQIFKNCAKGGNCGGISLLALALYKYGGYMGFCSPACFYTGINDPDNISPDREDLHRAMNILQARQFSSGGINNFLDMVDAGTLNDAVVAFNTVRDALARGDYPVLSIANSLAGAEAHTVIPYRVVDGSPKKIYIWDSNVPYNQDPAHYDSGSNVMTISSATDWTYVQSSTRTYTGGGASGAWCFAIPMSIVLPKQRQPMALDMLFDALMTAFVSGGPGSAVSQISDDEGHCLYKNDADTHTNLNDVETNPAKRLKGVGRWPWPGGTKGSPPGELYFIRGPGGGSGSLNFTFSGNNYSAMIGAAGNMIQIEGNSSGGGKDVVRLSNVATAAQSVRVETLGADRELTIKQLRTDTRTNDWRCVEVKRLKLARGVPVTIDVIGDMEAVAVASGEKTVGFDLDVRQWVNGQLGEKTLTQLATTPGQLVRVAPRDWSALDSVAVEKLDLTKPRVARSMSKIETVQVPAQSISPQLSSTKGEEAEFQPLTKLEYRLDKIEWSNVTASGEAAPEGYRVLALTLAFANSLAEKAQFEDTAYSCQLLDGEGQVIKWDGRFYGEKSSTGMGVVSIDPNGVLRVRVLFAMSANVTPAKFVFSEVGGDRHSYTNAVSAN